MFPHMYIIKKTTSMLNELKAEMLTQNKRSTSWVIFIVVEDKKIYGMSDDFADGCERKEIDHIDLSRDLCEECMDIIDNDGDLPDECEDCRSDSFINYRIMENVPNLYAAFFFTAKACNEHIAVNPHHYNKTAKSYGISACKNYELRDVMEYIVGAEGAKELL